ncbi:MAG: molybdopterin-guanine dinucleotide biosynthesis protein B [Lachnospiraceae bacterium]|nr:molybdopterin-guanine dinucleotide biosynthesis protein B [Lachnospiraceae bacterium]
MKELLSPKTAFPPVTVGILAGGRSRRMGEDKAGLILGKETILERLCRELSGAGEVLISSGKKGLYEDLGFRVILDENRDIGPIEGIRRILAEASDDYVFVCAADMPFVTKELVSYLEEFISSDYDCYVIRDEKRVHPLCAIYHRRILPVLEELVREGKYRLMEVLLRVRTKYVSLELSCFDPRILRNLNTKEDFMEARKPFVFCVSGYSDSGKTWLIEKLINEFIREGFSAAVLKHDGHGTLRDHPGSDTDRLFRAGADPAACFSEEGFLLHSRRRLSAEEILGELSRSKAPPDVVILEGMKHSPYPKVEIIRKGIFEESVCDSNTLICIASDFLSPDHASCPVYAPEDVRGIFLCIRSYFHI